MRPRLPPSVVLLMCRDSGGKRLSVAEQAKRLKMSWRHTSRMVNRASWDEWNVGTAERWCRICGWDFWDLNGDKTRLQSVDWKKETSQVRRALSAIYLQASGKVEVARTKLRRLADAISRA